MRRFFLRAAVVVALASGLVGCKKLGMGAGAGSTEAATGPAVEFTAVPGAPSFTPVQYNFMIIRVPGKTAPREPHVKLGDLVARAAPGGPPVTEKRLADALSAEGKRRGGNEMYIMACDASECRASLYRTGKEAEPYAKAGGSEAESGSSSGALPAWAAGYVPNNQALIKGLIGLWTPNKDGVIAEDAHDVFEKELLRSVLYVNEGPGARKEADKIFVYTDEASVKNAEGPKAKAVPVPPGLVIELALKRKQLLYVLYEEGNDGTSLFTALDENMLPGLHARAKASVGK